MADACHASVYLYAVPRERRKDLNVLFIADGSHRILGWIQSIENGPETAVPTTHRLTGLSLPVPDGQ